MINVYEVSRKCIMLFTHNNRYLPLTGLLTLLQWTIQPAPIVHCEICEIFQKYFTKYFVKYFTPKNFMKFYITTDENRLQALLVKAQRCLLQIRWNDFINNDLVSRRNCQSSTHQCWPLTLSAGWRFVLHIKWYLCNRMDGKVVLIWRNEQ